jgi:hypothetical protein
MYKGMTCINFSSPATVGNYFASRVILSPYNETVNSINHLVMELIPGGIVEYLSADEIVVDSGPQDEFLFDVTSHTDIANFPPTHSPTESWAVQLSCYEISPLLMVCAMEHE